jgi:membrane-bound serine protease (ClpP class)
MGKPAMVGRTGIVSKTIDPVGSVQFQGELWTAELAEGFDPLPEGTRVEVVKVEGLRLKVRRVP